MTITDRARNAWNVFRNKNPVYVDNGPSTTYRPDIIKFTGGKERSIVTSILNRIATDAASVKINHVKIDENGRFVEEIKSSLNECLTIEANIDQTGRDMIQDGIITMLDKGCVAFVPMDYSTYTDEDKLSIRNIRVGRILEWYPKHVKVELYNDQNGQKEQVVLPKRAVAIVYNPFYSIMNSPNSMMQRLVHKLALLDAVDDKNSSGKLDLIIRLPYAVRGEIKKSQAEDRRKKIEDQLIGSQYGIAYIDSTEEITQLNRPIENNLMKQIEFLTTSVYSQLGFTTGILDGTANEETMTNYYSRIIEPILSAIADEFIRKFLTKTARSQGQTIMYFKDPFKLVPATKVAEIGDKMKRNEIMSSNELRQIFGMKPAQDDNADKLINSNIRQDPNVMKQNSEENKEQVKEE